jgi:hypothetical protein
MALSLTSNLQAYNTSFTGQKSCQRGLNLVRNRQRTGGLLGKGDKLPAIPSQGVIVILVPV